MSTMLFDIERDNYREWYRSPSYNNFVVKISCNTTAHMTNVEKYYMDTCSSSNTPVMCDGFRMKAYMYAGASMVDNLFDCLEIPDNLCDEEYVGSDITSMFLKCCWAGLLTGRYYTSAKLPMAYQTDYGCWSNISGCNEWTVRKCPDEKKAHRVNSIYLSHFLSLEEVGNSFKARSTSFNGYVVYAMHYYDEDEVSHTISSDGESVTVRFIRISPDGGNNHIKVVYKLGRWVRRYILTLTTSSMSDVERDSWASRDSFVEFMVNSIRGEVMRMSAESSDDIRIVEYEGEDIWNAYNRDLYMSSRSCYGIDTGDLWDSCMRYDYCEDRIKGWYGRALVGVCKCVAILYDGYIIARALLWKVKGNGWMIDRVYSSDPAEKMLVKWASEQGIGVCKYVPGLMLDLSPDDKTRIIAYFTGSRGNSFPYVDTFYGVWWKAGDVAITSNIRQGGIEAMNNNETAEEEEFNRLGALQCTDGRMDYSSGAGIIWGVHYSNMAGRRSISEGDDDDDYEPEDE